MQGLAALHRGKLLTQHFGDRVDLALEPLEAHLQSALEPLEQFRLIGEDLMLDER